MKDQLNLSMGPMEVRMPRFIDEQLISRIPSKKEAIRQCIYLSGMTAKQVARELGIDQGHMSRVMSDQAHFPDDKEYDLMMLCKNFAPLQWMALKCGFRLAKESAVEKEKRALKERLALLEAADAR